MRHPRHRRAADGRASDYVADHDASEHFHIASDVAPPVLRREATRSRRAGLMDGKRSTADLADALSLSLARPVSQAWVERLVAILTRLGVVRAS